MKIGTIKAEALKLMYLTGSDTVGAEDIDMLESEENLRPYLFAMTGAINRCLSDIEVRRILPTKTKRIGQSLSGTLVLSLSEITDFYDVERVSAAISGEYRGNVSFFTEGDFLMIPDADAGAVYTLIYHPKIRRLSGNEWNTEELEGIPDAVACLIPYYIKGELYREDEPNEAGEARNWYESGMALIHPVRDGVQDRVRTVYSQVML